MICSKAGASPRLSGGEYEGRRSAVAVGSQVNLGGESSAGTPQSMVSRLPDLRPIAAGSGGVLMCPNDGGVDGNDPFQVLLGVRLGQQSHEHPLPGAVDRPLPQTVARALP